MRSIVLKSLRNAVLASLLVTGCGEPIPVDLTKASDPCETGAEALKEGGMMMAIVDGQLTVVPQEREVRAFFPGYTLPKGGSTTQATCVGCH